MKIILISGKARHGKNQVAEYIKDILGKEKRVMEFAYGDEVKRVAKKAGWDGNKDEKGRTLLQEIGDKGRKVDIDLWVNRVYEDIKILEDCIDVAIITDCRHENEVDWSINKKNATSLRVRRIGYFDDGMTKEQRRHISETGLDNYEFDYYMPNDSGLKGLKNEVYKFLIRNNMI